MATELLQLLKYNRAEVSGLKKKTLYFLLCLLTISVMSYSENYWHTVQKLLTYMHCLGKYGFFVSVTLIGRFILDYFTVSEGSRCTFFLLLLWYGIYSMPVLSTATCVQENRMWTKVCCIDLLFIILSCIMYSIVVSEYYLSWKKKNFFK